MKKRLKSAVYISMVIALTVSACTSQSVSDSKEETKKTESKKSKKKSSTKKKKDKEKESKKVTIEETDKIITDISQDIDTESYDDEEDLFSTSTGFKYGSDSSTTHVVSSGRYDPAAAMAAVLWERDGLFSLLGIKEEYENASEEDRENFLNAIGGEDSDGYKVCMGGISVYDMPVKELNAHVKTINEAYNEYINSGEDIDLRYEFKKYVEEN